MLFIVPGYIISREIEHKYRFKYDSTLLAVIQYIFYSLMNFSILALPFIYLYKIIQDNYYYICLSVITSIVIFPYVLGKIVTLKKNFRFVGQVPIFRSSWDYKFSSLKHGRRVIVHLISGNIVAGYMGNNSVASADPVERDIYIEKAYTITRNKRWVRVPGTDGILIKGNQIAQIEFFTAMSKKAMIKTKLRRRTA